MSFHYLGDGLCPGGGCELANICCLIVVYEGLYFMQVNAGFLGEKIFNIC